MIDRTYVFNTIKPFEKGLLKRGTYLGLFGVDGIPHLGLIRKGKYYSVNANKVKIGTPVDKLLTTLEKKSVKSLFVEINEKISRRKISGLFGQYEKGLNKDQTCLKPIKEVFDLEGNSIEVVSDLLNQMDEKKMLGDTYGLNISKKSLSLMPYTKSDIERMIKKIKSKK